MEKRRIAIVLAVVFSVFYFNVSMLSAETVPTGTEGQPQVQEASPAGFAAANQDAVDVAADADSDWTPDPSCPSCGGIGCTCCDQDPDDLADEFRDLME